MTIQDEYLEDAVNRVKALGGTCAFANVFYTHTSVSLATCILSYIIMLCYYKQTNINLFQLVWLH